MRFLEIILIFLIGLIACYFANGQLIIGSFNIQSLGPTKMSRPQFVSEVVKILEKYDIVLIQEIKDSSLNNSVINQLVNELNNAVQKRGIVYDKIISPRLGSSSYKEQLAYLFRVKDSSNKTIKVSNQFVYNDTNNIFERSPYVANFSIDNTDLSIKNFFLVNVHIKPTNVLNESLELSNVVNEIKALGNNQNIGILGDFNFDCRYISQASKSKVYNELNGFVWYIRDKYATTISTSSCALDRIILTGNSFNKAVVLNSNKTFNYFTAYNIDVEEALSISDHLPVEIQIL